MFRTCLFSTWLLLLACGSPSLPAAEIEPFEVPDVIGGGPVRVESDYLPSVVACENGAADFEALKVQAVAARTYLYFKMQTSGSIADGTSDQVFTCGFAPQQRHFDAVEATRGQVLTHETLTPQGAVTAAFYVAGALATYDNGTLIPGSDPTNTERFVTYNQGLSGDDVRPTPLGSSTNPRNRGAMSQNGSDTLSEQGWTYDEILPFYYGADIQLVTAAGFDPQLTLSVSRASGAALLRNTDAQPIDFDAYSIHSPSGSLLPGGWRSLEQTGLAGWQEANPSTMRLSELNLSGSTELAPGGRLALGALFDVFGAEDLTLEFHRTGGDTIAGRLDYFGAMRPLGDTDGDGDVDIDDLNNVRNNFGNSGAGVPGDTDGDAVVDIDDLNNVRNRFGATAAVPEPSTLTLAAALLCGLFTGRAFSRSRRCLKPIHVGTDWDWHAQFGRD